jgi:competence protein ComEC
MPQILRLSLVFLSATLAGLFTGPFALVVGSGLSIVASLSKNWLLIFAALGIAIGGLHHEARNSACWRFRDGQTFQFTGVLESLPVSQKIVLRLVAPCRTIVSARLPKGVEVAAGREFKARGHWQSVVITNDAVARPGGGTLLITHVDSVTNRVHPLLRIRARTQARIRELFPKHAGLAEALLVAQRDGLDPEIKARYAASGLTHLLAISGTHVALVAAVLWMLARMARLPRKAAHTVCVVGTAAYVFFLGAPFAAVRALLQLVLLVIARNLQRPAHALGMVAAAALIIVAVQPHAVIDAGFQLSFAGIAAIVLWRRPLIDKMPASIPTVLRDAVATTVAATLATTPIAAFHFSMISTVALLANLLAIPAVTVAVPACAAAVAISSVSLPTARFVAAGAELSLASLDRVAIVSAALPHGHFAAHPAQLISFFTERAKREHLEIHMIDVGQGDAIALRTPAGKWILVDAGPASPSFDAGERRVVPFLLEHGVRTIDALIITHPDLDHFGGARAIVSMIAVKNVYDPGIAVAKDTYDSLLTTAMRRHTAWHTVKTGTHLEFDEVSLEFLHPDTILLDASEAANDYSAVFRLTYGAFSALFLGDVSRDIEDRLTRRNARAVDVDLLKVAHHGSSTSTSAEMLATATPEVALVSVGRRNRYRHPNSGVMERLETSGAAILRTDQQGNVTVRVDGSGRMVARTGQ